MKLEDLFAPGGLLAPGRSGRAGARLPRAQFLLSGEDDVWTGLAMVELAARLGYECEAGDPERLVVRPGQRPAPGAVPIVLQAGPGGAGRPSARSGRAGPDAGYGRVEVVPQLGGAEYGLRLSAASTRDLWKLAAWLAAVGIGPLAPASEPGRGSAGSSDRCRDLAPDRSRDRGRGREGEAAPWQAAVRLDASGRLAEVALRGIEWEPWQPRGDGNSRDIREEGLGPEEAAMPLDDLWTPRGFLGSSDGLQPDRVAVHIEPDGATGTWDPEELAGLIMFAFRLGLESTGMSFPLTSAGSPRRPFLVKLAAPSAPDGGGEPGGRGRIRLCRRAGGAVLWITGDAAGRGRALQWLATAHASEVLRPAGSRRPALDSPVVALEREAARHRREVAAREVPRPLFEAAIVPEGERFRKVWYERALPAIRARCRPDDEVWVDLRLDQPDDTLEEVAVEVHRCLTQLGFAPDRVHVRGLPAFRQGLFWLLQVVPPAVAQHAGAHTVIIEFARVQPAARSGMGQDGQVRAGGESDAGVPHLDLPIRWLQPLYPVDELLAARTGLPVERIVFKAMAPAGGLGPTYRVTVADRDGQAVWRGEFRVAARRRPYQDVNPHLGHVYVETGLCRVERGDRGSGGGRQPVFEELLPTGAELFWDRYQAEALPLVARHLEEAVGGDLRADQQPFFLTLEVDVQLDTRVDEPLGVRQESLSLAEGLHEDVYFNTLDFFEEWGRKLAGTPFTAPGKVVPRVRARPGKGTMAKVRLTGVGIGARLLGAASSDGGRPRVNVYGVTVDAAGRARATLARAGGTAPTDATEMDYDEAVQRAARAIGARVAQDSAPAGGEAAVSWQRTLFDDESLGQWLAKGGNRSVRWSVAGHSFEGRPLYHVFTVGPGNGGIPATVPGQGADARDPDILVVPAKATLFRPTVLFKARHHANEVSSTNALLALVERHLDATAGINCVMMPLENTDGAALHRRLSQENPRWSLHSARYNALGQEYAAEYFSDRPRAPETRVFPDLWSRWLPDVVVDEHGVPSHEWVQPFGAHGGGRKFTSYWLPRALIYGILPVFATEDGDGWGAKQYEMAEFVARFLEDWPAIARENRRWLAVYRKYAADWLPEVFTVEMVRDFVCYRWPVRPDPGGRYAMQRHPEITGVEFITEAADETATGPYLETCAMAHLAVDLAILAWLKRQPVTVEETVTAWGETVHRERRRRRPWSAGCRGPADTARAGGSSEGRVMS
ncbi:hypothetical protein DYI95_006635 [Thermaerobacter sp. PB12/4term]|uniref:M14 family metallopeptidase n=1 Tax=Thermaerobacter sp. PB12/4term TaxID=2293838 RepID=UPI000E3274DB|nr:M14 family metallopeptidase [Thermaerobacter sp. PB12/4term]QIA27242.1 hypothetical protein DYI95_006635 [Thermaerobacter sp. PB12/4term]